VTAADIAAGPGSVAHLAAHRAGGPVGLLAGSLRTPDGWPVPDAAVTVVDPAGRQVGFTVTDDAGTFLVEVSAAGQVTVVLAAAGSQPLARVATAAPGERYDFGVVELVAAAASALPTAGTWSMDPAHSIVRATARHIGLARVEGRFTEFTGSVRLADPVETSTVEVVIAAASITTGNEARDTHLRSPDFLDVERFPEITYRGTAITALAPDRATITGQLTIRDVTREVPLRVSYVGAGPDPWGGSRIAFTATAQLARRDYEISWNMGLPGGLTVVGPTLQIDLDIEAVRD